MLQHAGMLKILNLSHSKQLVDISSISSAPNLVFLILEGCTRLLKVVFGSRKYYGKKKKLSKMIYLCLDV